MHSHSIDQWTHEHAFLGDKHDENERRTWFVVILTLVMMVAEIVAGSLFGSMALLADGWHMGTHAAALGIAAFAYRFARRHLGNAHFTFGTGKFGDLAAFASAIILGLIAVEIAYESVLRLITPVAIGYGEAIAVAALGLCVNLASAWLLRDNHHHDHGQGHGHGHGHGQAHHHDDHDHDHHHHHHDNNLRAAYVHVMADAATSVLAIAALLVAMYSGWVWADPAVGLIGSVVIASWAFGLIKASGAVLLDVRADEKMERVIRARMEVGEDRVTDLHLWQVGPGHCAVLVSLVSDKPKQPAVYKKRLAGLKGLSHVTVEVETCPH
ncbi:CDF family Co(II)/Ni(II) efflux transporter DmeF [Bradyrhizobium liaoningense]|uniref:CDF family Co(II)/Ni(II) efflux transporter DmeF n=1 Tax=Bradyrhizobium liaoningense TaxID=43992 RepID=UPI001BAA04F6|nr:CDF family Co(II)/Ni(II) efflux transporter DmeF [Bradyrhizobium liaoningense]MBR0717507.1 CDF family Co(II)/Ni(II) efflux transporter DmeF [Bradyrhizobium liaoningense]